MNTMVLNDGTVIPTVGFGVFQIPNDGSTYRAVRQALEIGYRHIDTAAAYFNEGEVGQAVRESGIPREEIFVTSKLWLQDHGYGAAKAGIQASLDKLGLGYIDLYLVHQPYGDVPGAWKAMEEAKTTGKLHAIGVSNMTPKIWNTFVPQFTVQPAVNQVEFNPFFPAAGTAVCGGPGEDQTGGLLPPGPRKHGPAHPSGGHRSGGEVSQDKAGQILPAL